MNQEVTLKTMEDSQQKQTKQLAKQMGASTIHYTYMESNCGIQAHVHIKKRLTGNYSRENSDERSVLSHFQEIGHPLPEPAQPNARNQMVREDEIADYLMRSKPNPAKPHRTQNRQRM
jgi:hypothetical protein